MTDEQKAWWSALLDKVKQREKIQCLITAFIEDTLESNGHTFRVRIDIEGIDPEMEPQSRTVALGEVRDFWHAMRRNFTDEHAARCSLEILATEIFVYMSTAPWETPTSAKKIHAVELRRDDGIGAMVRRRELGGLFGGLF